MKTYPLFMNSAYVGRHDLTEFERVKRKYYDTIIAKEQKIKPQKHRIYAYKLYDDCGKIRSLHLVNDQALNDHFDAISALPNVMIYATHMVD